MLVAVPNRLTVRVKPLVCFTAWMFFAGALLGNSTVALFIARHFSALHLVAIPVAAGVAYAVLRMWRRVFRQPEFSADQRRVFMAVGFSAAIVLALGLCGLIGGLWLGFAASFNHHGDTPVRARTISQAAKN